MGDWLQILMALSFADFSFGLVPHLPYHHRTSQPMVTHMIGVCVSLETESGKCKRLETRGCRPCTFYQVVSISQKTHVGPLCPCCTPTDCFLITRSNFAFLSVREQAGSIPFQPISDSEGNPWNSRIALSYTAETFLDGSPPCSQLTSWYRGAVWALLLKNVYFETLCSVLSNISMKG